MAIYIDSAIVKEVESARFLSWVRGVTTNPILLAKAGGDANQVLADLARLDMRPIFYQLVSLTLEGMQKEMESAEKIIGSGLVLKVPPTQNGFQFASHCTEHACCITAIYSTAQAQVASDVNARYIAVYVNRATHQMGDGLKLVSDIATVLKNSQTEIIAASVKSSEEACAALLAGAHHLTLPLHVLVRLITHPLSEQAVAEFQTNGVGIHSSP